MKNQFEVECIKDFIRNDFHITRGATYLVESHSDKFYIIVSGSNKNYLALKEYFSVEKSPKRGDKVWVWMNDYMSSPKHLIFLSSIEGAYHPIICVRDGHEDSFRNNIPVLTCLWDNMSLTNPNLELARNEIKSLESKIAEIKNRHSL